MQKAKHVRAQRRLNILNAISLAEPEIHPDSPPSDRLLELKTSLKLEDLLEAERALVYTRSFWDGKIDTPNKQMFKLRKKKKARDFVPFLKGTNGTRVNNEAANLDLVFQFFNDIFSKTPNRSMDITGARAQQEYGHHWCFYQEKIHT